MAKAEPTGTGAAPGSPPAVRAGEAARAALALSAAVAGYLVAAGSGQLFHSLTAGIAILVHFGAFVIAWYARDLLRRNHIVLLGTAFLFVAALDSLHLLAQGGSGAIPATPEAAGRLWLLSRLLEATAFLTAAAFPARSFAQSRVAALCAAYSALAVGATLGPAWLQETGAADAAFAVPALATRIATATAAAAALALLAANRGRFDLRVHGFLALAAACALGATLAPGHAVGPMGFAEFAGRCFGLAGALFVFKGVVETGLIRPQALVSVADDRQRRLAAEIERRGRELDAILSATPDMTFLFDRDLRFRYANAAAAQAFDVPQAAWAGRSWRDFQLPPEVMGPIEAAVWAVLAGERPRPAEVVLDGRHQECKVTPLFDVEHRLSAVLVTCRDVTERVRGEERLRRALSDMEEARLDAERADAAKTRFLAAASHDLRQPLQAMRLLMEVLAARLAGTGEAPVVAHAIDALEGSEDLLRSLLDLSTLQAGTVRAETRDFALGGMLDRLAEECRPQAEAKGLDLRVMRSSAVVRSDPVLLQRILRNLLVNAIRYTERGRVLIGVRRARGAVRILVVDTGPGIPEDKIELVFEEFYQIGNQARNRVEGLGLGLSIVRKTAELLGHELWAASRLGVGSAFSVAVPLGSGAGAPAARPGRVAEVGRLSALVIEDDPLQLGALRLLLEGWGHAVSAAGSGEAALAQVEAGLAPTLVVTDYRLPGSLSGIGAVEEIRRILGRPVPAVLLTGDTDPDRLRAARRADLKLLHKPYLADRLRQTIAEAASGALTEA
jgi:PAS domain S-box-containing protein